ncbi:MAG: DUF4417 domain-containing protein [Succinivibrionaceae bacterium]|nr:DUF4417 domain-containing protein [Succinivibrionaceae bacterium]
MSKINSHRKGCKDVFNAFLVATAKYAGEYEIPCITTSVHVPNKLISFTKALTTTDFDQWVHFYEHDYLFECVWKFPKNYLGLFKKFNGVILPDFSLYRDMPFNMQISNIYRSRAIGNWLQKNDVKIIPNIRFGDERTYKICCEGIEKGGTIAIGSHGNMKCKIDRIIFLKGLEIIVDIIRPSVIVVYGTANDKYFSKYKDQGILIVQFNSEFAIFHKKEVQ